MVPASSYSLALISNVQKIASIAVLGGKKCKRGNALGDNMAIYRKYDVVFLGK
jgi:hypothetical protein